MPLRPTVLWRATRAYSLPASVVPVLLGTVLSFRGFGGTAQGHFDGILFLVVLLGSILAHFGANLLNDYFDFILGVDTRPEHGSGVLTGGHMTARQALVFGLVLLAAAAACGLFVGISRIAMVAPPRAARPGVRSALPGGLEEVRLGRPAHRPGIRAGTDARGVRSAGRIVDGPCVVASLPVLGAGVSAGGRHPARQQPARCAR